MILASDYDGTFHVEEEQTLRNLEAVKRWRKRGHQFGLVTGRSYEMVLLAFEDYSLPLDFLICNNGATIYQLDGTVRDHRPMSHKGLKEFFLLPGVKKIPKIFALSSQGTYALRMKDPTIFGTRLNAPEISMEDLFRLETIWQFSLGAESEDEAAECANEINQLLGEYFTAYYNMKNIDVVTAGMSKSNGIRRYTELEGKPGEQVLVIGDGGNDVDMIREFHGYTIKSGCAAARQTASKIFASVEELIDSMLFPEPKIPSKMERRIL